jgi:dUTP pyrophosphatase
MNEGNNNKQGDMVLRVQRLSPFAVLPCRGSPGAAGYDLSASRGGCIEAKERRLLAIDLALAIPEGHYGRIAPRSGLAAKKGIDVGAGVIDSDYRGPVHVLLLNNGNEDFHFTRGDRIAQLILERIATPPVAEVESLDSTERGAGGFGSTG